MEMAQSSAESLTYLHAVSFQTSESAKRVYDKIQEAIYRAECSLSIYRLQLKGAPFVVVLGDSPPAALDEHLRQLLVEGKPADLPSEAITMLIQRRIQVQWREPWMEGHYVPEKRPVQR